ncbi:MAG: hypothetical protein COA53_03075 [Rhodobacteraceae bacterium]|nr:MAG: hypothetical protein COA53_03075 [Paracoccaceae bacterium]
MPLFRPEAMQALRRWREPAFVAVFFALSVWFLWKALVQSSWISGMIGLAMAAVVGSVLYVSYMRASIKTDSDGPGIVEVREREITYFAPENGGSMDLDMLLRLQLSTLPSNSGDRNWILWYPGGSLVIPTSADGAGALVEAFAALPNLGYDKIVRAMKADTQEIFTIWQRGS